MNVLSLSLSLPLTDLNFSSAYKILNIAPALATPRINEITTMAHEGTGGTAEGDDWGVGGAVEGDSWGTGGAVEGNN